MGLHDSPGALGPVGGGVFFEAFHADWPAYPGDRSWPLALLRLGDFPLGTDFRCLEVIDQAVLFLAEVGIQVADPFSDKHMHVAVRLAELLELEERDLVAGVELEASLSPDQINMKRGLGPELWDQVLSGETTIGARVDGEFIPLSIPADEDESEDLEDCDIYQPRRSPERVAMYPGTVISLTSAAKPELERVAKISLQIPPSLQDRVLKLLHAGLFDSAIRDTGAALEMRMRAFTGSNDYGQRLVERYIAELLATGDYYPARLKSLRQELRSIYKFIRNEFAHNLRDLDPSRGYALLSRLCWHVADVEGLLESRA